MRRKSALLVVGLLAWLWPSASQAACGPCKAEQITVDNASKLLFGGTDPGGGIDDWYVTNGKVQAIIDDIGTVPTSLPSVEVGKTSSNAVETGGTLVDLGLFKKNSDQIPQSFNVGGLSLSNVIIFRQGDETAWGASGNPCASVGDSDLTCAADTDCAAVTVYGVMLSPGVSTRTVPTLLARTRYQACDGENALQMRTEVWNTSGSTQNLPIFDIFLWAGRNLVPFVPNHGRGFNHPEIDLSDAIGLVGILNATNGPYFVAPGNVGKKDNKVSREKKVGDVSYGFKFDGGQIDANGPLVAGGEGAFIGGGENQIKALHSSFLSAVTFAAIPGGPNVPTGQSVISNRRMVLGKANDVDSAAGSSKNPQNLFDLIGFPVGTLKGRISPGSKSPGTVTFIRTGGSALTPPIADNSPVNSIRTKAGFKVRLPEGTYSIQAVFPGRPDLTVDGITVTAGGTTSVPTISMPEKNGKLKLEVRDADTNALIPAKISISPNPGMKREFEAFDYDPRTGMCDDNFSTACTADGTCATTCFRTCNNVEPTRCESTLDCTGAEVCASDGRCRSHACSSDSECGAGHLCVADTSSAGPESFPGGPGQQNVIYTYNGKVKQEVKAGTGYTLHVSRGPEYSIQKIENVDLLSGKTLNLGAITLKRVVGTTGYMSADFHIHSARSLDSSVPLYDRVASFAGEGLEVMVSTDHDVVTDYSPVIDKLKLTPFVSSIIGTEVTTSVGTPPYFSNAWGHINAWPQHYNPDLRRSGSVEDENVGANVIYDRMRGALPGNLQCIGGKLSGRSCATDADCPKGACTDVGVPAVQLNHPRAGVSGVVDIGMFANIGFDPSAEVDDCKKYPVICPSSQCFNGTNDGTSCTSSAVCTGGGVCGCVSASVPLAANGCNDILNDMNVVPQGALCTTPGCGSGFQNPNETRNIDFDVMEIDNGGAASSYGALKRVRRDWLSLLNQAVEVGPAGDRHILWGTGVSDTHRLVSELPGYSRTYVGAGDDPAALDVKAFNDEVRGGNMVLTAGPYVEFTVDNGGTPAEMGDVLGVTGGGTVNLNITVKAAPWIPVEEVRVIKNGCVIACYNSTTVPAVLNDPPADQYDQTAAGVVRFSQTVTDSVSADSYFIVEASPNMPSSGTPDVDPVVDAVAAGLFPFAMTNPVFVDTDANGDYDGIGVPEPVCGPLPGSCSAGAAVASVPMESMYADVRTSDGLLGRMSEFFSRQALACATSSDALDEHERAEEHEKVIRRSAPNYFPLHYVTFPTPRPEEMIPPPAPAPE